MASRHKREIGVCAKRRGQPEPKPTHTHLKPTNKQHHERHEGQTHQPTNTKLSRQERREGQEGDRREEGGADVLGGRGRLGGRAWGARAAEEWRAAAGEQRLRGAAAAVRGNERFGANFSRAR